MVDRNGEALDNEHEPNEQHRGSAHGAAPTDSDDKHTLSLATRDAAVYTPSHDRQSLPPLSTVLSANDFADIASRTTTPKAYAFYSSAATDLHTLSLNTSIFSSIWLRPRVLRNVSTVSTSTVLFPSSSHPVPISLPLYAAPAALASLIHPSAEPAIARACSAAQIPYVISTNTSIPLATILSSVPAGAAPLFFQLYVSRDRAATARILRSLPQDRFQGVWITVDAPVPGKREADERVAVADGSVKAPVSGAEAKADEKGAGLGRTMGRYIDDGLAWADLPWLRDQWGGRIVLKGVQGAADARRAVEAGVDGIVISNHGGRSLDTVAPAVLVLLELRRECPEIFDKLDVYVDSGIRRGTDIVKCLCLGAKAVGMGRSFLYALNYGQEGVTKLVDIMRDEVVTTMKMMGVTRIEDLHPGLLNTLQVDHLIPRLGDEQRPPSAQRRVIKL